MSWGRILSNQRCPVCGNRYPSSKGDFPIVCQACKTQPTKFLIQVYWQGKEVTISRDRDGKTLDSFRQAHIALDGIRAEHKSFDPRVYQKQSATSFKAFWQKFVEKYKKASYDKIESVGRHHILPTFEKMQLRDLRAYHIDDWWMELQKKNLEPKTLNDIHEILHRFLNQAYRLEIIEKIPLFPNKLTVEEKHIRWLTREQQEKVLEYIPEYDKQIFRFLFRTGVRVNEATGLQKSDIIQNEGLIVIQHTIDRDSELGPTKGRKAKEIPLTPYIEETLRSKVFALSPYQFTNKWGRHYSDDYLRDRFNEACDAAGIPRIPLKNASRHSKGMQWLRQGLPLSKVKEGLGHSNEKLTRHYVRQMAEDLRELYEDNSLRSPLEATNKGE